MRKNKKKKSAEIFDVLRLTTSFGEPAKLKPNILSERALKRLAEYEDTGITPWEILQLKETVAGLQAHIKKLEEW